MALKSRLFFVRFAGNSFHPKRLKLISLKAKLISPMAKLIFETKKSHLFISFALFVLKSDSNSFKIPTNWTYFPILLGIFDEKVNIFVKIDQIGSAKAKNSFHKVPKLISQMPKTHFFGILREWTGLDFAQKKSLVWCPQRDHSLLSKFP